MPSEFPYMNSVTNVGAILDKIKVAGTPPKFTHEFLKSTLGFASSNDRGVIKVLKSLNFLTGDSVPTERYNDFRHEGKSGAALASGLREGWSEIFLADEQVYERTPTELTGIFKNVSGKGEAVAKKMATTFNAFAKLADWSAPTPPTAQTTESNGVPAIDDPTPANTVLAPIASAGRGVALHQDVHIHLPPTSDASVYAAIFRALREELLD
jgi:hypothetical protein